MATDPNDASKLALVAFFSFLLGVAGTVLFVWFDPFHVLGHSESDEFRTYRDRGSETVPASAQAPQTPDADEAEAAYFCPMHPDVTHDEPGRCSICDMRLVPKNGEPNEDEEDDADQGGLDAGGVDEVGAEEGDVHAGHDHANVALGTQYTCSMHPEVIEDEPGFCPICNMRLTAIDADVSSGDPSAVQLTSATVQRLNVRTVAAEQRDMLRNLRTVGYLEYDQERMVTVTTKYRGFVEKVFVASVGAPVRRGQPLFTIYSPELVQTQQELLSAVAFAERMQDAPDEARSRAEALVEAARTRLGYWDVPMERIDQVMHDREVFRELTVSAPRDGLVMQITPGLEGMAIAPGTTTFHIADLTSLWLSVEVFEDQVAWISEGTPANVSFAAFPGESFRAAVRYLEPAVSDATRTLGVKIAVKNPGKRLRAGMFATVIFEPPAARDAVVVPSGAVLRTGTRELVIVETEPGRFEPREVHLGYETGGDAQIVHGLDAGEIVVTSAQFLLDSEANLRAAIARLGRGRAPEPAGHQHL